MRRTVRFPKKVVAEEADARFDRDVLIVEVPKQEREESFNVKIK
jgi:HSP20 family protein